MEDQAGGRGFVGVAAADSKPAGESRLGGTRVWKLLTQELHLRLALAPPPRLPHRLGTRSGVVAAERGRSAMSET